jgi:uncharacterized protein YggE
MVFTLAITGSNTGADSSDQSSDSTISVSVSGSASAAPDVVNIQLGVDLVDTDPMTASKQNSEKMNDIIAMLGEMGVAETDIQIVNLCMWVEYVYGPDNQLTGEKRYRVSNQVSIRLRDLSQIGRLVEETMHAGTNSVSGITFAVADTTQLEQEALDDAIVHANQQAEWVASKMSVNLGQLKNVIESG